MDTDAAPMTVEHVMAIKRALDLAENVAWPNGSPEGLSVYCELFIRRLGEVGVITPATAIEAHRLLAIEASGGPHEMH